MSRRYTCRKCGESFPLLLAEYPDTVIGGVHCTRFAPHGKKDCVGQTMDLTTKKLIV